MSLGKVVIPVEFCSPLTVRELSSCLRDPAVGLSRRLASVAAELTLAYPLAPPGGVGPLEERRRELIQLGKELVGEGVGVGLWPILEPHEWKPLVPAVSVFTTLRVYFFTIVADNWWESGQVRRLTHFFGS